MKKPNFFGFLLVVALTTEVTSAQSWLWDRDDYNEDSVESENSVESRTEATLSSSANKASYGEECGQWIKCESEAWLQCTEGRCLCIKQDEMIFDEHRRKCIAKAGERCRYTIGRLDHGDVVFRDVDCVEYSACSSSGVCTCSPGLYETLNGTCAVLKEYKEHCESHVECNKERGLTCSNGLCDCNESKGLIHDEGRDECIARAGSTCRYTTGEFYCVDNAYCGHDGVCKCSTNFYKTRNGSCNEIQSYLGQCESDEECLGSLGLGCYEGRCDCNWNMTTWRDDGDIFPMCVGLPDRPCVSNDCHTRSSCVDGMCRCDPYHFRSNFSGICAPQLGLFQNCSADYECSQENEKLKCVEGKCQCDPEISTYATVRAARRPNSRNPHGNLGYETITFTGCVPLPNMECQEGRCASGSYCDYNEPNNAFNNLWGWDEPIQNENYPGICKCEPHLTLTKNKTCRPGHKQPCGSNNSCVEGLACINKHCSCKLDEPHQSYDPLRQKCYAKFNGPCDQNEDCGRNALCTLKDAGPGHCACSDGYVPNSSGTCEAVQGSQCQEKADCDSIAGLNCINGVCECPNFGIYQLRLRKCVGKVGSRCLEGSPNECIENATCVATQSYLPGYCQCEAGYAEEHDYTCSSARNEILGGTPGMF